MLKTRKLLVVVPYRNREAHLKFFLENTPKYFKNQNISYDILICELDAQGDWNAGLCCNSIINFIQDSIAYEYIYIHHIDVSPIEGDWSFPDKNEFYTGLGDFGSCLLNFEDFMKVEGYSNLFWGWGGEDNDLYTKLSEHGIIYNPNGNSNVKFNQTFQNHVRKFNGKNYSNTVKILYVPDENQKSNMSNFYECAYIKDIIKLDEHVYKQLVCPLIKSPNEYKHEKILLGYLKNKKNTEELMAFLKTSMLFSSYNYDIAICIADDPVDETLVNELKAFGVTPYIVSSKCEEVCIDRYYAYKKFLSENAHYKYVLHTDVTDVFFQNDPFIYVDDDLIISSENIKIKNETWNSSSIQHLYGKEIYENIKNQKVLCGGIIGGSTSKFLNLCDLIISEYDKFKTFKMFGIDQPIIQKLVYNDDLDINIIGPESAFAINLHVVEKYSNLFKNIQILDNKSVSIYERNFSIVHQYNRFPKLYKTIQDHYINYFHPI